MKTVLLVDDEADALNGVREALRQSGEIEVVTAGDGRAALCVLGSQPVDLVVSDQSMPKMDGVELLAKVAGLLPDIPRILLCTEPGAVKDAAAGLLAVAKDTLPEELSRIVLDNLHAAELDEEQRDLVRHGGVAIKQLGRASRIQQKLHRDRALEEILLELGSLTDAGLERVNRARQSRMTLVELLHHSGALSDADLAAYRRARAEEPEQDDRTLLLGGQLVTEEAFLRAWAAKNGWLYLEPEIGVIDSRLLAKTSLRYLKRHVALPVHVIDDRLRVIFSNPSNTQLIGEMERIFGMRLELCCCATAKVTEALQTLERLRGGEGGDDAGLSLQYREIEDLVEGEETGEEAVPVVDYLLTRAIQLGASDLHVEPLQTKIRVRVRVDGVLQELTTLPIEFAPRVVSRVKILAGCDIAEKRLHQDGKIFVKVDGSEVDIRVSSYVSVYGETLVMRLLDRNKGLVPLDKIGFQPKAFESLTEVVLETSSGLVLLVGPTGSGKTTTLYSFIEHANNPGEKVITAEDPVEYVMDGIIQCSVNQKTGPTFSDSLRAIVRQDPDTIVVGEIRDKITASLALESALTGHKVFSTFHTEDAVGAFVRMLEMGAESFLVASTVAAIVAQRLMRRLCPHCKRPAEPDRSEMRFLGLERSDLRGRKLYGPKGCGRCGDSGFKGRLAIHEVLLPDDEFRNSVMHRVPAKEMRKLARKLPEFLTLQEDGVLKAFAGLTTLGEVVTNAPRDTAARPPATLINMMKVGRRA